jgi:parallel beta-helix repeat protein
MMLKAANNAQSALAQAIDATATSFSVVDGSSFPTDNFLLSADDEIMLVGSRSGNTFSSVTRGHEGTTAAAHVSGAAVENRFTAGAHMELVEALIAHKADGTQHAKTARFVIGTSTAGWTSADCDYLCDGTADQTEINAAITALPATGGEVVILDGTYNITAKINVTKDNVSIRGNGNATILKRGFNSPVKEGVITLSSRSGCKIANLQIEGNKTGYTNSNNYGIYLSSSSDNTVTGNTCNNNNYGINLSSSSKNTITGNACNNNNSNGIYLGGSSNNTITGNTCNNNNSNGIYLSLSSNENTITGNACNNNNSNGINLDASSNENTITGNACNNNNSNGINLNASSNNTITGNTCNNNNSSGIYLGGSSNNTITGNTCIRGTGLATDYTASQYTIQLYSTKNNHNLISSNNCMGKAVTNGGGTGNTLVNNKFDAS